MKTNFIVKQATTIKHWIKDHLPHITYEMLQQAIRKGDIKLNNKKIDIQSILDIGDVLSIWDKLIEDLDLATKIKNMNLKIIYENNDFIVIDKPYGISVQGGVGIQMPLVDIISEIIKQRAYVVHRLDKNTTGIMIFAKNNYAATDLSYDINYWQKTYLAKLEPREIRPSGTISAMIENKTACTKYKVLESNQDYILTEFTPITGRMHQIRKHAAYYLSPIIGDIQYGSRYNQKMYLRCVKLKIFFRNKEHEFRVEK